MSADPHLMINRSPGFWYEVIFKMKDKTTMGISLPGFPTVVMGSKFISKNLGNDELSWSFTFGFMDQMDYFIEKCKNGKCLYDGEYKPIHKTIEYIEFKNQSNKEYKIYETPNGILEIPFNSGKNFYKFRK